MEPLLFICIAVAKKIVKTLVHVPVVINQFALVKKIRSEATQSQRTKNNNVGLLVKEDVLHSSNCI